MIPDLAALFLAAVLIAIAAVVVTESKPQPDLPLVDAAMPIIAPTRSTPCNIPPPAPKPERNT